MQNSCDVMARQRNALRTLLLITLPVAVAFTVFSVQLGAPSLALLASTALLLVLGLLVANSRNLPFQPLALTYLCLLFAPILGALATADVHSGMETWLGTMPAVSYLLLKVRVAQQVTSAGLVAATIAYSVGADGAPHRLDPIQLVHVATPILVVFLACHLYARSQVRSEEEMFERMYSDPLTGLWNRAKLMKEFPLQQRRAHHTGMPLSLVLIDLDRFKQLNDAYGHDAGDAALVFVSGVLKQRVRETDLLCRFGGEEFAILLPGAGERGALKVAEDLRRSLEATPFQYREVSRCITLSAGIAELGRDGESWLQLYRAADTRLYLSKERGRNRIVSRTDESALEGLGHNSAQSEPVRP